MRLLRERTIFHKMKNLQLSTLSFVLSILLLCNYVTAQSGTGNTECPYILQDDHGTFSISHHNGTYGVYILTCFTDYHVNGTNPVDCNNGKFDHPIPNCMNHTTYLSQPTTTATTWSTTLPYTTRFTSAAVAAVGLPSITSYLLVLMMMNLFKYLITNGKII